MRNKKILVNCSVISLQDTGFVYPCCKHCLSKSAQESEFRSRCIKCGFTCDIQNVDYRYRLSLKVSRGRKIFGVTVFGGCLNPFFGITAGDLQRFVDSEKPEGPQSLVQLLIKSVEDCFIGKSFVFGFKLSGNDAECCLFDESAPSLGFVAESSQLVACQIIIPNGALLGMTVFAYLQRISQANWPASQEALCQSQQKDSLLNSFECTLPLCRRSHTEATRIGLTQLWQPTFNLDLCFSQEETSKSLQQFMEGDAGWSLSQNVQTPGPRPDSEWSTKEHQWCALSSRSTSGVPYPAETMPTISTSDHVESRDGKDNSCSDSPDSSSTLSPVVDMLDLPKASDPINSMFYGHQPKRSFHNHWSSQDLHDTQFNASLFGKSFALENAPLSETLGSFVSMEPHISKAVDVTIHKPKRNRTTPKKTLNVLTPFHNVTNLIQQNGQSLKRKHQKRKNLSLSTSGTPKVSQVPEEGLGFCEIKDKISNSVTTNPVNMVFQLQSDQRRNISMGCIQGGHADGSKKQSHNIKDQEGPSGGDRDEYNCSADLFCQSSLDITTPDATNGTVPDPKERKKYCVLDINIPECEVFNTIRFDPTLQSTPNTHPYHQRSLSRRSSGSPCTTKTMIYNRHLGNYCKITSEAKAVKLGFDQIQTSDFAFEESSSENSGRSAGASEVQGEGEHVSEDSVLPTNEWSRDLFDN